MGGATRRELHIAHKVAMIWILCRRVCELLRKKVEEGKRERGREGEQERRRAGERRREKGEGGGK